MDMKLGSDVDDGSTYALNFSGFTFTVGIVGPECSCTDAGDTLISAFECGNNGGGCPFIKVCISACSD